MRAAMALTALVTLAACGGGGTGSGDKTTTGIAGVEGEDRQVLVDLRKRGCAEGLSFRPNLDAERARRACDCAIDRLVAGKSADAILATTSTSEQRALEERTADQCLAEGK